jgi:hypothetical protein
MLHTAAEELLRFYDSMEPYEVCGEELREAYVDAKKLLKAPAGKPADVRTRAYTACFHTLSDSIAIYSDVRLAA